jgi:hypothetical protein
MQQRSGCGQRETVIVLAGRDRRESDVVGGERGIRTPDTLAGTPDFESGAFSRSASSPLHIFD